MVVLAALLLFRDKTIAAWNSLLSPSSGVSLHSFPSHSFHQIIYPPLQKRRGEFKSAGVPQMELGSAPGSPYLHLTLR